MRRFCSNACQHEAERKLLVARWLETGIAQGCLPGTHRLTRRVWPQEPRSVSTLKRRGTRAGNRIGVWMYRTLDGRFFSFSKDVHVLMVTTPGRRTGLPRSTCVRYLDSDDGFIVWGTGSGSPRDPDWFRNLREVDTAEVQVKADRMRARVRELVGADRDAMWDNVVLAQAPEVAKYAKRAGRVIPVAVLEPIVDT